MKIVVDCANGAASDVAPEVLLRLGAEVIAINAEPDAVFYEPAQSFFVYATEVPIYERYAV